MTEDQGRCIKQSARIARKNAKFLSSPAEIVQFTAKSATQSGKIEVVKNLAIQCKNNGVPYFLLMESAWDSMSLILYPLPKK